MKKYIKPQIELIETEVNSILAGSDSLPVSTTPTSPTDALAPEISIIEDDDIDF